VYKIHLKIIEKQCYFRILSSPVYIRERCFDLSTWRLKISHYVINL